LAQSLEVITHAKASPEVQAVSLAAFLNLAQGLKALIPHDGNERKRREPLRNVDRSVDNTLSPRAPGIEIALHTRDVLSWGSLMMGIAFAHAGLGLPHALVHFCKKFGMSHGHMVGILLVPGLLVQARHNPATAVRLQRVERTLERSGKEHTLHLSFKEETTALSGFGYDKLLGWLEDSIRKLFGRVGLETSLSQVGLSLVDLEWIASKEHALGASFGIPRRPGDRERTNGCTQSCILAWEFCKIHLYKCRIPLQSLRLQEIPPFYNQCLISGVSLQFLLFRYFYSPTQHRTLYYELLQNCPC